MSDAGIPPATGSRVLTSAGALLAAAAIGLSAYAAHGVLGDARAPLQMAASFALGHGIALAAIAPRATRQWTRLALTMLLLGVLMFSGSLVAGHVLGAPMLLAPFGGSLLMLGWLAFAADALRR